MYNDWEPFVDIASGSASYVSSEVASPPRSIGLLAAAERAKPYKAKRVKKVVVRGARGKRK